MKQIKASRSWLSLLLDRVQHGHWLAVGAMVVGTALLAESVAAALASRQRPDPTSMPAAPAPIIVLVTIDGVRWQDVFEGKSAELLAPAQRGEAGSEITPHLTALVQEGVAAGVPGAGAPMLAPGPDFISLPGYTQMMLGRARVPCLNNDCPAVTEPTLVDAFAELGPPEQVAVMSSWPGVARAAASRPHRTVLSAGRRQLRHGEVFRRNPELSRLLRAGERSSAHPGHGDYRPDRHTAALALEYLRTEQPRFFWLSLGDTDEFGHRHDYPRYLDALARADQTVGQIWKVLLELAATGRSTALFVTTDHGRSQGFAHHGRAHPESSRIWMIAAGTAIAERGAVPLTSSATLADLAPTIRRVAGLSPGGPSGGRVLYDLLVRSSRHRPVNRSAEQRTR